MVARKCVHCGRPIREFNGVFHHYWWVRDLTVPGERRLRGCRLCAWQDGPAQLELAAEELGRVATPS